MKKPLIIINVENIFFSLGFFNEQIFFKNNLFMSLLSLSNIILYNRKSEKVGTVWKTQIKKESSDF